MDIEDIVFGQDSNRETPEHKERFIVNIELIVVVVVVIIIVIIGPVMAEAFSRPPLTAEDRVKSQSRHFENCGGQICSGTGFKG